MSASNTQPVRAWWPWGFVEANRSALRYARTAPAQDWPGWSTGESLLAALVLDRADVIKAGRWTLAEAIDRVDVSPAVLLQIARGLD